MLSRYVDEMSRQSHLLPTIVFASCLLFAGHGQIGAENLPLVSGVELQPLAAQVERVVQALKLPGAADAGPGSTHCAGALGCRCGRGCGEDPAGSRSAVPGGRRRSIPESRVKVQAGPAAKELMEQGWRVFLVKVHNQAGVTAPLRCTSPNAAPLQDPSRWRRRAAANDQPRTTSLQRWLDVGMFDKPPLNERLSGLPLEYRIVELFSRDRGKREAKLAFDVGQGTQDLGFRSEVNLLFDCEPCVAVKLEVLDDDGTPTTGHFTFRDARGRVYPARSRRLAPDFFFHDQVYRARRRDDAAAGRQVPCHVHARAGISRAGAATSKCRRRATHTERFRMKRWINLAAAGWFSGDHHVHAAGVRHYSSPDARRAAGRHDAAHPGRGSERRLRADLGTVLVSPEAVLRRQGAVRCRRRET